MKNLLWSLSRHTRSEVVVVTKQTTTHSAFFDCLSFPASHPYLPFCVLVCLPSFGCLLAFRVLSIVPSLNTTPSYTSHFTQLRCHTLDNTLQTHHHPHPQRSPTHQFDAVENRHQSGRAWPYLPNGINSVSYSVCVTTRFGLSSTPPRGIARQTRFPDSD